MKIINNTVKRVLTSVAMILVAAVAVRFGSIRWLAVFVATGMTAEVLLNLLKKPVRSSFKKNRRLVIPFLLLIVSAYFVGAKPYVMLLLLIIIASADIGAWFFGKKFGKDKIWERISPNKTWAGQIAGIICGTIASVVYALISRNILSLMWVGMGVSLLSQYGDLFASAIKRKLDIKDFSNVLPGHGGLTDRFDGWIFVLPAIWLTVTLS